MKNLNKENFWNDLKEKCPDAVEDFCKWVDRYKASIQWDELFANHTRISTKEIKFHDLPFDMQMGVLFRYLAEKAHHYGMGGESYEVFATHQRFHFEGSFYALQQILGKQSTQST